MMEKVLTDELSQKVARKLEEGKKKKDIIKDLVKKQSMPEEAAALFVENTERVIEEYKRSPEGRRELANKGLRRMFWGALWLVGGTVATVGTYNAAEEGGTYFIFWGAVLYGAFDFCRGLHGWFKYQD